MVARFVPMLLLRHGQSEWNAVRRWQGSADSPLSALGRHQAEDAATALAATSPPNGRFGSVWSSPLRRAADTGGIIADRLGLGAVRFDPRLREADAGEWQGLTPDEIEAAYPGYLASHRRPSTFEAADALVERTAAALGEIVAGAEPEHGTIIVTTHSGVIRTLVRHLGRPDERVPNLGGVWLGATIGDSATADPIGFDVRGRFDPEGVLRTGVDTPGEDPGEQADDAETDRGAER